MDTHPDIDDHLAALGAPARGIATQLRSLLDAALPDAEARLWHGHPVWMAGRQPLAGFKAHSGHVTFMIWHGGPVDDPAGRLAIGPHMATVKLRADDDVDAPAFAGWLHAAHATGAAGATR